jgi:putative ABC transport system permease protein
MQDLIQDVRFALRTFVRSPGVILAAAIALALGIGANSAVFSVVNAILIRPLPYRDAQNLVVVWENKLAQGRLKELVSALDYRDYRDFALHHAIFDQMGAFRPQPLVLTGKGLPERVEGASVSPSTFQLLGMKPALGRAFADDEDDPAKNSVAVLSDALWRRRFGADPDVLGRALNLDDRSYTVIGVAPPGFHLIDSPSELWIPYTPSPDELAPSKRAFHTLTVIAHLKTGVTRSQAEVQLQSFAQRLAEMYPDTNEGCGTGLVFLRDQMAGNIRPTLWTLIGAVAFILLIACANVANLLLARAGAREKEIAMRTSLGANPARIVRQLLTESVLLALAGGLLGLALAYWATSALVKLAPAGMPLAQDSSLDWRVLAFTLGVSLMAGVMFGMAPAFLSVSTDLSSILKASGRGAAGHRGRSRIRDGLVISEIACCVALLIGAGLLIRSLARLQQVNPGFRADHVLTMQIALPERRYAGLRVGLFYKQLLERVRVLPGVQSAGICRFLPLGGTDASANFQIEGQPALPTADQPRAKFRAASGEYFAALRIPLLKGRLFDRSDSESTPKVVIINQTAARRFWPNQDPIGKRILSGFDNNKWSTIVGVVGDVKHSGLDAETNPETYYHFLQLPPEAMNFTEGTMSLVLRTSMDPAAAVSSVRNEIRKLDPEQPVFNVKTMQDVVDGSIAQPRFRTLLLSVFGGLALLLAAIGLYAVMSYSVTQRVPEMGIRMALGAEPGDLLQMVLWNGLRLAVLGAAIGVVLALAAARLLSSILFEIKPADPATFLVTCLIILAIASIASLLPALKATRVDPASALRTD